MSSSIQDFIRSYTGLAQLQQQQQSIDDARENAKVAGINTFMTLARQTADPSQLTALVERFSQLGVGSPEQLSGILQNVTPTGEALQSYMMSRGIDLADATGTGENLAAETASTGLTGQSRGAMAASKLTANLLGQAPTEGPMADMLAAIAATRVAGNTTPGALVLDNALRNLPGAEQELGAGISLGTRLTPQQQISNAAQAAGLEFNWAGLRETGRHARVSEALQEVGLGLQARSLDVQEEAARARAGTIGVPDASNIASLVSTKAQLLRQITETKSTPTANMIMSYIGALNNINQQLSLAGVPTEPQLEYNADMLVNPGFWQSFKNNVTGALLKANAMTPSNAVKQINPPQQKR